MIPIMGPFYSRIHMQPSAYFEFDWFIFFIVRDLCDKIFVHLLEFIINFQTYYISLLEDEEIHYELADDFEDICQQQRFSGTGSHDITFGISNVKYRYAIWCNMCIISVFNLFTF